MLNMAHHLQILKTTLEQNSGALEVAKKANSWMPLFLQLIINRNQEGLIALINVISALAKTTNDDLSVSNVVSLQLEGKLEHNLELGRVSHLDDLQFKERSQEFDRILNKIPQGACFAMIHLAANSGQFELLECLIEHGANINLMSLEAQFFPAQTALHCAASKGCKDCINLLILRGADLNIKNSQGRFPHQVQSDQPNPLKKLVDSELVTLLVGLGLFLNKDTDQKEQKSENYGWSTATKERVVEFILDNFDSFKTKFEEKSASLQDNKPQDTFGSSGSSGSSSSSSSLRSSSMSSSMSSSVSSFVSSHSEISDLRDEKNNLKRFPTSPLLMSHRSSVGVDSDTKSLNKKTFHEPTSSPEPTPPKPIPTVEPTPTIVNFTEVKFYGVQLYFHEENYSSLDFKQMVQKVYEGNEAATDEFLSFLDTQKQSTLGERADALKELEARCNKEIDAYQRKNEANLMAIVEGKSAPHEIKENPGVSYMLRGFLCELKLKSNNEVENVLVCNQEALTDYQTASSEFKNDWGRLLQARMYDKQASMVQAIKIYKDILKEYQLNSLTTSTNGAKALWNEVYSVRVAAYNLARMYLNRASGADFTMYDEAGKLLDLLIGQESMKNGLSDSSATPSIGEDDKQEKGAKYLEALRLRAAMYQRYAKFGDNDDIKGEGYDKAIKLYSKGMIEMSDIVCTYHLAEMYEKGGKSKEGGVILPNPNKAMVLYWQILENDNPFSAYTQLAKSKLKALISHHLAIVKQYQGKDEKNSTQTTIDISETIAFFDGYLGYAEDSDPFCLEILSERARLCEQGIGEDNGQPNLERANEFNKQAISLSLRLGETLKDDSYFWGVIKKYESNSKSILENLTQWGIEPYKQAFVKIYKRLIASISSSMDEKELLKFKKGAEELLTYQGHLLNLETIYATPILQEEMANLYLQMGILAKDKGNKMLWYGAGEACVAEGRPLVSSNYRCKFELIKIKLKNLSASDYEDEIEAILADCNEIIEAHKADPTVVTMKVAMEVYECMLELGQINLQCLLSSASDKDGSKKIIESFIKSYDMIILESKKTFGFILTRTAYNLKDLMEMDAYKPLFIRFEQMVKSLPNKTPAQWLTDILSFWLNNRHQVWMAPSSFNFWNKTPTREPEEPAFDEMKACVLAGLKDEKQDFDWLIDIIMQEYRDAEDFDYREYADLSGKFRDFSKLDNLIMFLTEITSQKQGMPDSVKLYANVLLVCVCLKRSKKAEGFSQTSARGLRHQEAMTARSTAEKILSTLTLGDWQKLPEKLLKAAHQAHVDCDFEIGKNLASAMIPFIGHWVKLPTEMTRTLLNSEAKELEKKSELKFKEKLEETETKEQPNIKTKAVYCIAETVGSSSSSSSLYSNYIPSYSKIPDTKSFEPTSSPEPTPTIVNLNEVQLYFHEENYKNYSSLDFKQMVQKVYEGNEAATDEFLSFLATQKQSTLGERADALKELEARCNKEIDAYQRKNEANLMAIVEGKSLPHEIKENTGVSYMLRGCLRELKSNNEVENVLVCNQEALTDYQTASSEFKNDWGRLLQARMYEKQGSPAQAIKIYKDILEEYQLNSLTTITNGAKALWNEVYSVRVAAYNLARMYLNKASGSDFTMYDEAGKLLDLLIGQESMKNGLSDSSATLSIGQEDKREKGVKYLEALRLRAAMYQRDAKFGDNDDIKGEGYDKAIKLYSKGMIEMSDIVCTYHLAEMYEKGGKSKEGGVILPNPNKAMVLYRKILENDNPFSAYTQLARSKLEASISHHLAIVKQYQGKDEKNSTQTTIDISETIAFFDDYLGYAKASDPFYLQILSERARLYEKGIGEEEGQPNLERAKELNEKAISLCEEADDSYFWGVIKNYGDDSSSVIENVRQWGIEPYKQAFVKIYEGLIASIPSSSTDEKELLKFKTDEKELLKFKEGANKLFTYQLDLLTLGATYATPIFQEGMANLYLQMGILAEDEEDKMVWYGQGEVCVAEGRPLVSSNYRCKFELIKSKLKNLSASNYEDEIEAILADCNKIIEAHKADPKVVTKEVAMEVYKCMLELGRINLKCLLSSASGEDGSKKIIESFIKSYERIIKESEKAIDDMLLNGYKAYKRLFIWFEQMVKSLPNKTPAQWLTDILSFWLNNRYQVWMPPSSFNFWNKTPTRGPGEPAFDDMKACVLAGLKDEKQDLNWFIDIIIQEYQDAEDFLYPENAFLSSKFRNFSKLDNLIMFLTEITSQEQGMPDSVKLYANVLLVCVCLKRSKGAENFSQKRSGGLKYQEAMTARSTAEKILSTLTLGDWQKLPKKLLEAVYQVHLDCNVTMGANLTSAMISLTGHWMEISTEISTEKIRTLLNSEADEPEKKSELKLEQKLEKTEPKEQPTQSISEQIVFYKDFLSVATTSSSQGTTSSQGTMSVPQITPSQARAELLKLVNRPDIKTEQVYWIAKTFDNKGMLTQFVQKNPQTTLEFLALILEDKGFEEKPGERFLWFSAIPPMTAVESKGDAPNLARNDICIYWLNNLLKDEKSSQTSAYSFWAQKSEEQKGLEAMKMWVFDQFRADKPTYDWFAAWLKQCALEIELTDPKFHRLWTFLIELSTQSGGFFQNGGFYKDKVNESVLEAVNQFFKEYQRTVVVLDKSTNKTAYSYSRREAPKNIEMSATSQQSFEGELVDVNLDGDVDSNLSGASFIKKGVI